MKRLLSRVLCIAVNCFAEFKLQEEVEKKKKKKEFEYHDYFVFFGQKGSLNSEGLNCYSRITK